MQILYSEFYNLKYKILHLELLNLKYNLKYKFVFSILQTRIYILVCIMKLEVEVAATEKEKKGCLMEKMKKMVKLLLHLYKYISARRRFGSAERIFL